MTAVSESHPSFLARRGRSSIARRASNPQGMRMMTSGSNSTTWLHNIFRESCPALPRSSLPPAIVTISGTQWPEANTGSYHSAQKTLGLSRPLAFSLTTPILASSERTSLSAAASAPHAFPTVMMSSSTPSRPRGLSETTSQLWESSEIVERTSRSETEQTSQSS